MSCGMVLIWLRSRRYRSTRARNSCSAGSGWGCCTTTCTGGSAAPGMGPARLCTGPGTMPGGGIGPPGTTGGIMGGTKGPGPGPGPAAVVKGGIGPMPGGNRKGGGGMPGGKPKGGGPPGMPAGPGNPAAACILCSCATEMLSSSRGCCCCPTFLSAPARRVGSSSAGGGIRILVGLNSLFCTATRMFGGRFCVTSCSCCCSASSRSCSLTASLSSVAGRYLNIIGR